jgi:broad specificity phosphatase PhoE
MPLLVVRHARAGSRRRWDGPDEARPLSGRGRTQATALVKQLLPFEPKSILSSPYVRCVQSVEPLAAKLGLAVESRDALAEGVAPVEVVGLAREVAGTTTVLCTHGDVIEALLAVLVREDGLALPDGHHFPKGSTWVLTGHDGRFRKARYLPPKG